MTCPTTSVVQLTTTCNEIHLGVSRSGFGKSLHGFVRARRPVTDLARHHFKFCNTSERVLTWQMLFFKHISGAIAVSVRESARNQHMDPFIVRDRVSHRLSWWSKLSVFRTIVDLKLGLHKFELAIAPKVCFSSCEPAPRRWSFIRSPE